MSTPSILESSSTECNEVQLIEAAGEWFVRVVEHGRETRHRSFQRKRLAIAYAEAERERLGIEKITKV